MKLWEVGTGRMVRQYLGATHTQLRCQVYHILAWFSLQKIDTCDLIFAYVTRQDHLQPTNRIHDLVLISLLVKILDYRDCSYVKISCFSDGLLPKLILFELKLVHFSQ